MWKILGILPSSQRDDESQLAVKNLEQIIQDLLECEFKLPLTTTAEFGSLRDYHSALLLIYLASVSRERRTLIVERFASIKKHSELTKELLLNEAALIATAIETSDENDHCYCSSKHCCKK